MQRREQNLIEKITEQETKRKELEEERKKVDRQAEEYGRLISLLRQKTLDKEETDVATQPKLVRPPRVKVFSFRKLFQGLLGKDTVSKSKMVDNPLPNRMESIHAIRRITSSPGNTGGTERRSTSDRHDSTRHHDSIATTAAAIRKHMRRSSDEMGYRGGTLAKRVLARVCVCCLILGVGVGFLLCDCRNLTNNACANNFLEFDT